MSLTAAVDAMFDSLRAAGEVDITYSRGAASVALKAVPAVTVYEAVDNEGVATTYQGRDYIVRASELVLSSAKTLPERFDTITEGSRVYEVRQPAGGREYDYTDQYRTLLRIHTVDSDGGA